MLKAHRKQAQETESVMPVWERILFLWLVLNLLKKCIKKAQDLHIDYRKGSRLIREELEELVLFCIYFFLRFDSAKELNDLLKLIEFMRNKHLF